MVWSVYLISIGNQWRDIILFTSYKDDRFYSVGHRLYKEKLARSHCSILYQRWGGLDQVGSREARGWQIYKCLEVELTGLNRFVTQKSFIGCNGKLYIHTKRYVQDFITTLLPIAPNEKLSKCPPTVAWLNTLWGIHIVECHPSNENEQMLRERNKTPEFIQYYLMCTKLENWLK